MAEREKTFTITMTHSATIAVGDLWPDGDAPAHPTRADVEALIKEHGGYTGIIRGWDIPLVHGTVTDNAEFKSRMERYRRGR